MVEQETPYQLMDMHGNLQGPMPEGVDLTRLLEWYRWMYRIRFYSDKVVALQRQGRATTWGPLVGQEATAIGMAAPLQPQDWMVGSYRDAGAYLVKGYPLAALFYTMRGVAAPPELVGPDARCLPYQIVLATQTLHGVGLAMASQIKGEKAVTVAGVGDGATSEGDFNEALNFAGVYKAPVVMVVVNNGWAISTPRSKQSAAEWLAHRGKGFGIPARLVDGNDVLAVYEVMKEAVDRARAGEGPTLVETITYRLGAHTTADDPTRYRPQAELDYWQPRDPVLRLRHYLMAQGALDEADDKRLIEEEEQEVNAQQTYAYNYPLPQPEGFFDNVYEELTPRLQRQRQAFRQQTSLNAEGR
ncbi:MAG TPA: thiamine pyrophosphate-dependent enzyme [Chloroflexia bacterium]|nr:thiamine pyrophosphate-dependent enzyme [Chloroflexia bacterium]